MSEPGDAPAFPRLEGNPVGRLRYFFGRRLVFLTAALCIASVIPLFGPWHWLPDLFSHFVPQYAVGGLVCAGGLFWARRRRWAMLALGLFLVHALRLLPYWTDDAGHVDLPPTAQVRVLQYNVNRAHPNPAAIIDWIKTQSGTLDIVALMEVTPGWRAQLARLAKDYPNAAQELRLDNFGIAVLTRLPGARLKVQEIGGTGVPSVLVNGKSISGTLFSLIVTHPPPPLGGFLATARNRQLETLAEEVKQLTANYRILLGDLNITPWSVYFSRLLAETGLRDAQLGFGYSGTWPGSLIPRQLGIPIDHTLVSQGVRVLDRTIGEGRDSDHRPIISTLVFDPEHQ